MLVLLCRKALFCVYFCTTPTERRGRMFNTPVSYSWDHGFKSQAILAQIFRAFPKSLQADAEIMSEN
jgi:hypothetical protein